MTKVESIAFIVTKPLQLMNAMSIIDQLSINDSAKILMVDSFCGAEEVARRFPTFASRWGAVSIFRTHREVYAHILTRDYQVLFIDSDVGLRKYLTLASLRLRRRKLIVNVYEEGLGTYRTDLYSRTKGTILKALGIGTYFGGCGFTSNLFLYSPCEYLLVVRPKKDKLIKIEKTLSDFIRENLDILNSLFVGGAPLLPPDIARDLRQCSVYMTNWEIDNGFLGRFGNFPGLKLLKPHPHLKSRITSGALIIVSGTLPAEILVSELAQKFDMVTIYHHGTSTERYIKTKNVRFVQVNSV